MKTLVFVLILIIGIFNLNVVNAQKVDSNSEPKIPNNWTLVSDSQAGKGIDLSKITFKPKPFPEGTDLSATFKKEAETGISACYLDFFLKKENQRLIPEGWKNIVVIFTGTPFMEGDKDIVYRTMYYDKSSGFWTEGKNYANFTLEHSSGMTILLN